MADIVKGFEQPTVVYVTASQECLVVGTVPLQILSTQVSGKVMSVVWKQHQVKANAERPRQMTGRTMRRGFIVSIQGQQGWASARWARRPLRQAWKSVIGKRLR